MGTAIVPMPVSMLQALAANGGKMRHLIWLLCALLASCGGTGNPLVGDRPLTGGECASLVRRQFDALDEGAPIRQKMIGACRNGQSIYTRQYFDCVSASRYSDTLECAYKARGIDRTRDQPWRKEQKVGEYGSFSAMASPMVAKSFHGEDPRTTIDPLIRKMYLTRRNRAFTLAGQKLPEDRTAPMAHTESSFDHDGSTYWVTSEVFTELQLTKIMRERADGIEEVVCARYGSAEKLTPDQGFCAALIKKYFHEPAAYR